LPVVAIMGTVKVTCRKAALFQNASGI